MRVSRHRRIDRIENHFEPPGSLARALRRLSPELREQYQTWRERTDRIHSQLEKRGENSYAGMLDDPLLFPPMPPAVELALFPYQSKVDAEIAAGRFVEAYNLMLRGADE